jgi:hypothetical protein
MNCREIIRRVKGGSAAAQLFHVKGPRGRRKVARKDPLKQTGLSGSPAYWGVGLAGWSRKPRRLICFFITSPVSPSTSFSEK